MSDDKMGGFESEQLEINRDIMECLNKAWATFDREWSLKEWDTTVKVRFLARRVWDEPYGNKWRDFIIDDLPIPKQENEEQP